MTNGNFKPIIENKNIMSKAQKYIEQEYTKFIQKELKKFDISDLNLTGTLDLSNFTKLEELNCANNQLTHLYLNRCVNLK